MQQHFRRHIFTTGVVITHPALNDELVEGPSLAELLFEAFLLNHPFERQDIHFSDDRHRAKYQTVINKGDRFLAIYDQTYGSLRLTQRLLKDDVISDVFQTACDLAHDQEILPINQATLNALERMSEAAKEQVVPVQFSTGDSIEI